MPVRRALASAAVAVAAVFFAASVAAAAEPKCRFSGALGYYASEAPECPARRGFIAERTADGLVLTFREETWTWKEDPFAPGLTYRLISVTPGPPEGRTGRITGAVGHPAIGGTIFSRTCGEGFVALTPVGDTCASPSSSQAERARASLPARGRSRGGTVRDAPSSGAPRIAHLAEGQRLTIVDRAGRTMNGLPFYRVRWPDGEGYQWGGILCATAGPGVDPGPLAMCAN